MTNKSNNLLAPTAKVLLQRALGFRDCLPTTLDAMVEGGVFRNLAKGEMLTRRGAPFRSLCLVVKGALATSVTHRDGHRHLVGLLQVGDVAGLIGLIDGLGHVHDLHGRAPENTVLLIPAETITPLRVHDPQLSRAFELQLAFRSRLMYEHQSADPAIAIENRLARLLITLGGLYGTKALDGRGLLLSVKVSQEDLADWLGVSRQRINGAMGQLRDNGWIASRYSSITLLDVARLRQAAEL